MKVTFTPFTKEDFYRFEEWEIEAYANALIRSKTESKEDALCVSAEELEDMLPDGLSTAGNFFFNAINEDGKEIGLIWYSKPSDDEIFISELFLYEGFKNQGFEEAILFELEKNCGVEVISSHVFDCDKETLNFYKNAGYEEYTHIPPASTYIKKELCHS